MLQIVEKNDLKKLNLRDAIFGNIFKDRIEVHFKKKVFSNGVQVEWCERYPNNIPINLRRNDIIPAYERIFIDGSFIGFLKDITSIDYWPKNNSLNDDTNKRILSTIVVRMKKGKIYFNKYTINGESFGSHEMELLFNNYDKSKNNLFERGFKC